MGEIIDGQPVFPGESEIDQLFCIQKVLGPLIPAHLEAFSQNQRFLGLKFPELTRFDSLEKRYLGKISKIGIHFLKNLLTMDPFQRITASEALHHEYFQDITENSRPKTSGISYKMINQMKNKPQTKKLEIFSNIFPSQAKTNTDEQRGNTRSSLYISETNEFETTNQKMKDVGKVTHEDNRGFKNPMFNIIEETGSKLKIKSIKKKSKIFEVPKLDYKLQQKHKFSNDNDIDNFSSHGSIKPLPSIHPHGKFEIKPKIREDDPDLSGGPSVKLKQQKPFKVKF